MRIIPAILEQTNDQFINQLHTLIPYFTHFHIDIADGKFVPNTTIQIEEITETILNQQMLTNKRTFDFHLMVNNYQLDIEQLKKLSRLIAIHTVFVHIAPFEKSKLPPVEAPFQIGIALNPEDEISAHWEVIKTFTAVQVMSVHPGFQGSLFLPQTLEKITHLRQHGFRGAIYLDGGINDKTLLLIVRNKYCPNVLCVGSYLETNTSTKLKLTQVLLKTELNQ